MQVTPQTTMPTTTTTTAATATATTAAATGSGGAEQAKASTGQLGGATLPATGPTQDALIAALTQLVATLTALIDALRGAQAAGGGPNAKGGGPDAKGGGADPKGVVADASGGGVTQLPTQVPTQTPTQVPTQSTVQAGGAAPTTTATTAPGTSTGAAPTTLQPVTGGYQGPYMSAGSNSVAIHSGSTSFSTLGATVNMQMFGRYGSQQVGLGENEITLSGPGVPIGTRLALPDSGSITLSTGATFAWSPNLSTNSLGMVLNEPSYTVTPAGGAALTFNRAALDTQPGFTEDWVSPLSDAELAELVKAMASRYPAVAR